MDTKEKHIKENESNLKRDIKEVREGYSEPLAEGLVAEGRRNKNRGKAKSNRLWIWLGVLILIFILVWWLFSIGTFNDLLGTSNG